MFPFNFAWFKPYQTEKKDAFVSELQIDQKAQQADNRKITTAQNDIFETIDQIKP